MTQGFEPDYKTSEVGTVTQELNPDEEYGGLRKVRLSKDLLNVRIVTCVTYIMAFRWE